MPNDSGGRASPSSIDQESVVWLRRDIKGKQSDR